MDGRSFDAVVHAATALQGKRMMRHQDTAVTNTFGTPKPKTVPLRLLRPTPLVHNILCTNPRGRY